MVCTEAYKEHIEYTFHAFCRVVIRYAAINAWRDRINAGLSLPCSSSALMNSHTPKLNNRRHIERHTKTGNHKKVSCFFAFIFGVFEKPPYCPTKRET